MSELALRGGSQACPPGTVPEWPVHDESEARAVAAVVASGKWWRMAGGEVDAFEREFGAFLERDQVLAVGSGTSALELALAALGLGLGDEVIVPAFTFAATATAVLAVGAVPVVVDVDPSTYCIDPDAVAAAITDRTRAIVPVHLAGHACAMEALDALAVRHGLRVVADAAHAHGARWRGKSVAALADVAIYSFQSFKLMSAGEGGALVTNDPEIIRRAWLRHSCGRPRGDRAYAHVTPGTNSRMTEFQGALLRAQLRRLPEQLAQREGAAERLDRFLREIPGLRPMGRDADTTQHAHYMYMVCLEQEAFGWSRDEVVDILLAEGVPIYRAYRSIADLELFHEAPPWAGRVPPELSIEALSAAVRRHPAPVARRIARDAIWIHHSALLGEPRVQEAIALAFQKVYEHGRRKAR
jgi:3-amino-5-hydroxybenzoate synthase